MSFKEKLVETKEKATRKAREWKDKAVNWAIDHPGAIVGILIGGATLGGLVKAANDYQKELEYWQRVEQDENFHARPQIPEETEDENVVDLSNYYISTSHGNTVQPKPQWDEKYREQWDRVVDFAKTLNLEDGEAYYIEDQKQYKESGVDQSVPVISHLVDNWGVYPPAENE